VTTALAPIPYPATLLPQTQGRPLSTRSLIGINAASFFLAEIGGVIVPFLSKHLIERGWSDSGVGMAISLGALGVLLMQTPAGFLVDRVRRRRALLAAASLVVGLCYGVLPLLPASWICLDPLLFVAGMSRSFFGPLLGALALGLAGHAGLNRLVGINQSWDHAGNLASALAAIVLLAWLPVTSIFYTVAAMSALAAGSVFLIRAREVDEELACGGHTPLTQPSPPPGREGRVRGERSSVGFLILLRDRRVAILFAAVALFHLANAPVMPLVGTYVARLHGTNVQVACVVLTAQAVMIPVAWLAGRLCESWGRKPVFAVAFAVLPLRILLYSLTDSPWTLVALQTLDGIGAGIYGVVVVAICADLTRGTGRFNALQGLIATALSAGGVIGPVLAGVVVQYFGFGEAFYLFAAVAAAAALVFVLFMPETKEEELPNSQSQQGLEPSLAGAAGW
jgi:MFS family permease